MTEEQIKQTEDFYLIEDCYPYKKEELEKLTNEQLILLMLQRIIEINWDYSPFSREVYKITIGLETK